jgi:hypothetical protein
MCLNKPKNTTINPINVEETMKNDSNMTQRNTTDVI